MTESPPALHCRLFDAGRGPWVVWIHGFLGSSLDFAPFAARLAPQFRSLLVDLPAHGASVDVPTGNVDDTARLVALAMDSHNIRNALVVGYSLGGRVALSLAAGRPRNVSALVLESTSPGIIGTEARRRRVKADERHAELLRSETREAFLAVWYRQSVFRSLRSNPVARDTLIASRRIPDRNAMASALVAFSPGNQTPTWSVLPRLETPILYLAGEADGRYSAVGRRVAETTKRASLVSIRNSGHVVHFEAPEAYFAATARFIKQHTPA